MARVNNEYPNVTAGFLAQIREHRKANGITAVDAAQRAGMHCSQWRHLESGRYRSTLDVVSAMAEAVGMRVTIRPDRLVPALPMKRHANRTSFQTTPVDESAGNAKPGTRRILAKLREIRRGRGLTMKATAHAIGVREQTFSGLERGKQEPSVARLAAYADTLGYVVDVLPEQHADFADLDGSELDAVRQLVVSYVAHAYRTGKPVPAALGDAADKLEQARPARTLRAA